MKRYIITLCFFFTQIFFGQKIQYVNAEQGLIIREKPQKNAMRIGKLVYGTKVRVLEETKFELKIKDGNQDILGKWVKVKETNGGQNGYVFNGYLTSEELHKKTNIRFQDFELQMELNTDGFNEEPKKIYKNNPTIYPSIEETVQGKKVTIKHTKFKKIEIYQQYENQLMIISEGKVLEINNFKPYVSDWKKLNFNTKENSFYIATYQPEDGKKFYSVTVDELKNAVPKEQEYWLELIKNIKSIHDYPSSVAMYQISFKIRMTDKQGNVTEKQFSIVLPNGC